MKKYRNLSLVIGVVILCIIAITSFVLIKKEPHPFPLIEGEVITSWDFTGSHDDDGELEDGVYGEIDRLNNLIDSGEFTNYTIYVSIANQYRLLGEGEMVYEYLGKAIAIDSEETGLAWHNMGQLLTQLGALKSAKKAFYNMVKAQPTVFYQTVYLDFLKEYFPEDNVASDFIFE